MRLDAGLFQQQTQKQILSPQMIQSMEILVLNQQQLEERISEELEENVTLERSDAEAAEEGSTGASAEAAASTAEATDDGEVEARQQQDLVELTERYEQLQELQKGDFWSEASPVRKPRGGEEDDQFEWIQQTEGRAETLPEHLIGQLRLKSNLSPRHSALCEEIIYNLDDRGWLIHPIGEIRVALQEGFSRQGSDPRIGQDPLSEEEMGDALSQVQSLDPSGVGANDLIDCLRIQLQRDPGINELEEAIVTGHLDDLARNRLPHIAKATGSSIEEIKQAMEVIRSLEPNPGRPFRQELNPRIVPDVIIQPDEKGKFQVDVNSSSVPRLRISPQYRDMLKAAGKAAGKDPELRKYLKKRIENAEWLIGAVGQRNSTLQRVAEEVVLRQERFFRDGDRHLQPLRMQDVADAVGVNVSTVSRAISGKWFQAPGMIRELRSLFSGGTVKDDGSQESRSGVIARIQELVKNEDPAKPLSDAQIVVKLGEVGVRISRRTVTKYRESEGIPSSRERRQY
ncbi:MAG: RNA polymerase factor sigma-54 [Planctomycetes bacterium]|nr:RNA polymerase factor sigma-54 [Planctomycetota bacterium]